MRAGAESGGAVLGAAGGRHRGQPVTGGRQGRVDAVVVGDEEPAAREGRDDQADADQQVRTPARGAGAPDDGRARPALPGALRDQAVENGSDLVRRDRALRARTPSSPSCSRVSASSSESPTSRASSWCDADVRWLRRSVLRAGTGSFASASRVARTSGSSLRSRCQMRAVCRRWAWLQACGRDPGLRVVEPLQLGPVVPGGDVRVADRAARGREVAGEGVREDQQPVAAVGVERVEPLGIGHGADHGTRPPVRARQSRVPESGRPPAWQRRPRPGTPGDDESP